MRWTSRCEPKPAQECQIPLTARGSAEELPPPVLEEFPMTQGQVPEVRRDTASVCQMGVFAAVHFLALPAVDLPRSARKKNLNAFNAVARFGRDPVLERTQSGLARTKAAKKASGTGICPVRRSAGPVEGTVKAVKASQNSSPSLYPIPRLPLET